MTVLRDVRFALRILARNPSYAVAAVTVLALGIGAVTAMVTVVRASSCSATAYRRRAPPVDAFRDPRGPR